MSVTRQLNLDTTLVYNVKLRETKELMQIQGIIDGKCINLSDETGLPDGTLVIVNIHQFVSVSLEEKRRRIDALCGSWAYDDSLEQIFAEIEAQRHASQSREVHFDVAS